MRAEALMSSGFLHHATTLVTGETSVKTTNEHLGLVSRTVKSSHIIYSPWNIGVEHTPEDILHGR